MVCCPCCCGGLPILALIKAALVLPFTLIIIFVGCSGVAVVMVPIDFYLAIRSLVLTRVLGTNVKCALILLLPAALCAWLACVFVGSLLLGIFQPLFFAYVVRQWS